MKLELKYGKCMEYYSKQMIALNIFCLSNSNNIALLLRTISVNDAKMRKLHKADHSYYTRCYVDILEGKSMFYVSFYLFILLYNIH